MTVKHRPRIAYPGAAGSYTAEASADLYPDADLYSAGTFGDVADHVRDGRADGGVLPIENSLAGLVGDTCDLLADGDLPICAETVLHIPHCLAGVQGSTLEAIRRVHSHPVALAQCRRFLAGGGYEQHGATTTADAVRVVADGSDPTIAAIASPGAAARYGLAILHADVSDHPENFTRFVAIRLGGESGRDGEGGAEGDPGGSEGWRTALRIVTTHQPGALHEAIEPLRYHGVNMVSLHSRPIPGEPWRYQFLVDVAGHRDDPVVARACEDVERRSALLVTLGTYRAAVHPSRDPARLRDAARA